MERKTPISPTDKGQPTNQCPFLNPSAIQQAISPRPRVTPPLFIDEVWVLIGTFLPAREMMSCRYVCKKWNSIITTYLIMGKIWQCPIVWRTLPRKQKIAVTVSPEDLPQFDAFLSNSKLIDKSKIAHLDLSTIEISKNSQINNILCKLEQAAIPFNYSLSIGKVTDSSYNFPPISQITSLSLSMITSSPFFIPESLVALQSLFIEGLDKDAKLYIKPSPKLNYLQIKSFGQGSCLQIAPENEEIQTMVIEFIDNSFSVSEMHSLQKLIIHKLGPDSTISFSDLPALKMISLLEINFGPESLSVEQPFNLDELHLGNVRSNITIPQTLSVKIISISNIAKNCTITFEDASKIGKIIWSFKSRGSLIFLDGKQCHVICQ